MTLKELSQLYYLNREIEADKRRLEELKASAYSVESRSYDGMPKAMGIANRTERVIAEITDLEAIISSKIDRLVSERNRLERYIADIPDSLTRQIFTLRFINGLSWVSVAWHIGGSNTEDSVKKTAYRYINKEKGEGSNLA